jgi:hypothetical protein
LKKFLGDLLKARGIAAPVQAGEGVEVAVRVADGVEFLFVVNHQAAPAPIDFLDWRGTDLLAGRNCSVTERLEAFGVVERARRVRDSAIVRSPVKFRAPAAPRQCGRGLRKTA